VPWGDPELKLARGTAIPANVIPAGALRKEEIESLTLRVAPELAWPVMEQVSRIEPDKAKRAQ
jgi:hypothetical protein